MVRQDFDTERLRALRAELEQQTLLLPAVLQSSNCVGLVDHLASIFKPDDWSSAAKCSQWSPDPQSAEPSGWSTFQDLLTQDTQPDEGQAELKAMDIAQTEMRANICSIQETTCLPPSRLAALASTLCSDNGGSLELVRCTVCHSLLLTTAFDDHLPRCRPCDPQSHVRPSRSSTPQPRQGSKSGLNAKGAKGSKKGKGRGSSKPPAGPSRFAIEQAKSASQQYSLASTVHNQPPLQKPQHPMQYPSQAPSPLLQCDTAPRASLQASQAWPASNVQQTAVLDSHQGNGTVSRSAGGMIPALQSQSLQRPRSAWTYDPGLSRSNPDVDAVHDPSLPPRFPQSVTRSRRKRDLSVEPEASALHISSAHAASRLGASAKPSTSIGSKQLQQGHRQSNANLPAPPAKRLKQASAAQEGTAEGHHDLWQHQLPDSAGHLHSSQNNGTRPSAQHRHAHESAHLSHSSVQHDQHRAGMMYNRVMGSSAAHAQMQHQDARQALPGQTAWSHLPSSHSQTQMNTAHMVQQPSASSHKVRQPSSAQAAAQDSPPYTYGAAMSQPAHTHQQPSHVPSMWSPVNGYSGMHGSQGASANRSRSGGWHMPESKRQVSVNALARSSYGT